MFDRTFKFNNLYSFSEKIGQFKTWFLFLVYIVVVSLLGAYFPVWANIVFFVVPAIFVFLTLKTVMFERLKIGTLIIVRCLIILPAINPATLSPQLFIKIVLAFLIINILEATFTDLLKNDQKYNFVSGLAVAGGVLLLGGTWISVMPDSPMAFSFFYRTDLAVKGLGLFESVQVLDNIPAILGIGTILYVVAYTIWNWLFVIGEFSPSVALLHVGILLAPMLCGIVPAVQYHDWTMWGGAWLLMRALTLTCGGIFQISAKQFVEDKFRNEKIVKIIARVKKNDLQIILMIINLLLLAGSALIYFMVNLGI